MISSYTINTILGKTGLLLESLLTVSSLKAKNSYNASTQLESGIWKLKGVSAEKIISSLEIKVLSVAPNQISKRFLTKKVQKK